MDVNNEARTFYGNHGENKESGDNLSICRIVEQNVLVQISGQKKHCLSHGNYDKSDCFDTF